MSIQNVWQALPGARKPIYDTLYVLGGVTTTPTAAVQASPNEDTINFTGGTIEFDGIPISLNGLSLDFGALGSLVAEGQRFVISAVPSYLEPADKTAAVTAGVNYFVNYDANLEAYAEVFISPAAEAAVAALGGIDNVRNRVFKGSASAADIVAFNNYEEERAKSGAGGMYGTKNTRREALPTASDMAYKKGGSVKGWGISRGARKAKIY